MKQLGIETSEYSNQIKNILTVYGNKLTRHALWQVCNERAALLTGNVPCLEPSDSVRSVCALLFSQIILGGYSKEKL